MLRTCLATGMILASGEWVAPIAAAVIAGIGGAVVSACITAHLALKKFREQRWWDEKFRAYRELMDALDESREAAREVIRQVISGGELLDGRPSADRLRKCAFVIGKLLLSDEARHRIDDLIGAIERQSHSLKQAEEVRSLDNAAGDAAFLSAVQRTYTVLDSALSSLINDLPAIARRDLGV